MSCINTLYSKQPLYSDTSVLCNLTQNLLGTILFLTFVIQQKIIAALIIIRAITEYIFLATKAFNQLTIIEKKVVILAHSKINSC